MTNFPLLGVADTINSSEPFSAPSSQSIYLPDHVINPHPRFAALTRNIRERRGSKVCIEVPLFKDLYTPEFLREEGVLAELPEGFTAEEGTNIHMDCMAFGMGMCCLVW